MNRPRIHRAALEPALQAAIERTTIPGVIPRMLNLGCGSDTRARFINGDLHFVDGIDIQLDASAASLPFANNSFEIILMKDLLEHVDPVLLLSESYRTLAPSGRLIIQSVHFTSRNLFVDPTHRAAFSSRTFDFFCRDGLYAHRSYYFDFVFSSLEMMFIEFHKGRYLLPDHLVERLVNLTRRVQDSYELTGVSRLFPAENVVAVLRK